MFAAIPLEEVLTLEFSMYMCMCVTMCVCVSGHMCDYLCVGMIRSVLSDEVSYSAHVIILLSCQSLCHINTAGSLKQLMQWTIPSLHTHNIATHIFATSHNC